LVGFGRVWGGLGGFGRVEDGLQGGRGGARAGGGRWHARACGHVGRARVPGAQPPGSAREQTKPSSGPAQSLTGLPLSSTMTNAGRYWSEVGFSGAPCGVRGWPRVCVCVCVEMGWCSGGGRRGGRGWAYTPAPPPLKTPPKSARPQRLDGGHCVGELVRRLAQHVGVPPALDHTPIGLARFWLLKGWIVERWARGRRAREGGEGNRAARSAETTLLTPARPARSLNPSSPFPHPFPKSNIPPPNLVAVHGDGHAAAARRDLGVDAGGVGVGVGVGGWGGVECPEATRRARAPTRQGRLAARPSPLAPPSPPRDRPPARLQPTRRPFPHPVRCRV
jgi:hypothetical protein